MDVPWGSDIGVDLIARSRHDKGVTVMIRARRVLAAFGVAVATVALTGVAPTQAAVVTESVAAGTVTRAEFDKQFREAKDNWINATATSAIVLDTTVTPSLARSQSLSGVVNPDGTLYVTEVNVEGKAAPAVTEHLCAETRGGKVNCFYREGFSKSIKSSPWSTNSRGDDFSPVLLVDGMSVVLGDLADEPGIDSTYAIAVNPDGSSTFTTVYTGPTGTVTAVTTIGTVYSSTVTGLSVLNTEPRTFFTMSLTPKVAPQPVPAAPKAVEPGWWTKSDLNSLAKLLETMYTDNGEYPHQAFTASVLKDWYMNLDPNGVYRICYNRGPAIGYVLFGTIPGADTYYKYDSFNGGLSETALPKVKGKMPKCSDLSLPTANDGKVRPGRPGPAVK